MNILFAYEWKLRRDVLSQPSRIPSYITLVLSEQDVLERSAKSIEKLVQWCSELPISMLSVYIDVLDVADVRDTIVEKVALEVERTLKGSSHSVVVLKKLGGEVMKEEISTPQTPKLPEVVFSVGFGGKSELVQAVRSVLEDVSEGELEPEDIDEQQISSHLLLPHEPDLVIRSGGKRLADFLVWQSVYSEIYFTDVNWKSFRKVDFLRAVRDFQQRKRRFGK
ncbi:MAG: undecaprenyl diphosphate synthase family protein [Methermicoccaceae archaeon]